jgi:hypothetical protein
LLKKWGLTPFSPLDLVVFQVASGEKGCLSPVFQQVPERQLI